MDIDSDISDIKAKRLNEAIVKKVETILNNTDCIESLSISIEGSRGEAPIIRYNIKEYIVY